MGFNRLLKNARGCEPSQRSCISTPTIAVWDASVTTVYGNFGSENCKIDTAHKASFKSWNAFHWYGPHYHSVSFLVNFVRGFATYAKFCTNHLLCFVSLPVDLPIVWHGLGRLGFGGTEQITFCLYIIVCSVLWCMSLRVDLLVGDSV